MPRSRLRVGGAWGSGDVARTGDGDGAWVGTKVRQAEGAMLQIGLGGETASGAEGKCTVSLGDAEVEHDAHNASKM